MVHGKPNTVRELVNGVPIRIETDVSEPDVVRLVMEVKEEGTIALSKPTRSFVPSGSLTDRNVSLPFWNWERGLICL